jgi:hypothetical protein
MLTLENLSTDATNSEYIIISGVQIHGALGHTFWWPGSITHFSDGMKTDLSREFEHAASGYDLGKWVHAKATEYAQQASGMSLPTVSSFCPPSPPRHLPSP